jgi:hypothetical protein
MHSVGSWSSRKSNLSQAMQKGCNMSGFSLENSFAVKDQGGYSQNFLSQILQTFVTLRGSSINGIIYVFSSFYRASYHFVAYIVTYLKNQ